MVEERCVIRVICFFFDGDNDPECHTKGPTLRHFRSASVEDVISTSRKAWSKIIANKISLPCTCLRVYEENGDLLSLTVVSGNDVGDNEMDSNEMAGNEMDGNEMDNNEIMDCGQRHFDDNASSDDCESQDESNESSMLGMPVASTPIQSRAPPLNCCTSAIAAISTNLEKTGPNSNSGGNDAHISTPSRKATGRQVPETLIASTIAQAASRILGESEHVIQFNNIHVKLKNLKREPTKREKEAYHLALTQLQQMIESNRIEITQKINSIEKEFFPILPVQDKEYSSLCKNLKLIKQVLRKLKMSL